MWTDVYKCGQTVNNQNTERKKIMSAKLIRPGSTLEFLRPNGIGRNGVEYKTSRGRAVLRGPYGWVVNTGGRYGTPAVVTEENFLRVVRY
jgi:hypothetical protein